MGYFGVDNFLIIAALNAFWLSRLPLNVDVITRLVALRKLSELAGLKPDPRHLQDQKRKRMSLYCRLMELLG